MSARKSKNPSKSYTTLSKLMTPGDVNFYGKVHGGVIMALADQAAYVAAAKHTNNYCVTARVDSINFHVPIEIGEMVSFKCGVNYAHTSSVEVGVRIESEDPITGKKKHTATCYFTMVAINKKGKPIRIPKLVPVTKEEKRRFKQAEARRKQRLKELKK
jgi:acyl-CoA hydrolase